MRLAGPHPRERVRPAEHRGRRTLAGHGPLRRASEPPPGTLRNAENLVHPAGFEPTTSCSGGCGTRVKGLGGATSYAGRCDGLHLGLHRPTRNGMASGTALGTSTPSAAPRPMKPRSLCIPSGPEAAGILLPYDLSPEASDCMKEPGANRRDVPLHQHSSHLRAGVVRAAGLILHSEPGPPRTEGAP